MLYSWSMNGNTHAMVLRWRGYEKEISVEGMKILQGEKQKFSHQTPHGYWPTNCNSPQHTLTEQKQPAWRSDGIQEGHADKHLQRRRRRLW